MFKSAKNILLVSTSLFLFACDSSDDIEDITDKPVVSLNALSTPIAHVVTYKNIDTTARHDDKYCSGNELRNGSDTIIGSWSITTRALTLSTGDVYNTLNGKLERGKTYTTQSGSFKVINIAETICGTVPPASDNAL